MKREIEWLLEEKYKGEKSEGFFTDCKRLEAGEPLAYIIGSIPFLNTTIYLDSHPLIPRPETEFWVEKAIKEIQKRIKNTDNVPALLVRDAIPYLRILDLCAGSGAIGVAVAKAITEAQVTFGEIDICHLSTIQKNIEQNITLKPSNRLEGFENFEIAASDLFENIGGTFDFILTNPPYIDVRANTVEKSVTDFEPALALFGGEKGFPIIKRIMTQAKQHLNSKGVLYIEHEPFQAELIAAVATEEEYDVISHVDQYGTYRYSVLTPHF